MFQKESHRELHLQNEDEIEKPKKDIYIYISRKRRQIIDGLRLAW